MLIKNNSETLRTLSFKAGSISEINKSISLINSCKSLKKLHVEVPVYANVNFNDLVMLEDLLISNASLEFSQSITILNNFKNLESLRLPFCNINDDIIKLIALRY